MAHLIKTVFGFWFSVFSVKKQIPLNPPLPKGDLKNPFGKGGQGGFFTLEGEAFVIHGRFVNILLIIK
jgi:hypothetical protein